MSAVATAYTTALEATWILKMRTKLPVKCTMLCMHNQFKKINLYIKGS